MGTQVPSLKGVGEGRSPTIFGPCLMWRKGWMDQYGTGMEVGLGAGHIVLDGDPATLPKKAGRAPNFWPISIVAKLDASRCHLYGGRPEPRRLCVRLGPSSPHPKRGLRSQFSAHIYCGQTAGWLKMPLGTEIGLSPGDIVLDGDPAPPPLEGHSLRPIFSQCPLWPND